MKKKTLNLINQKAAQDPYGKYFSATRHSKTNKYFKNIKIKIINKKKREVPKERNSPPNQNTTFRHVINILHHRVNVATTRLTYFYYQKKLKKKGIIDFLISSPLRSQNRAQAPISTPSSLIHQAHQSNSEFPIFRFYKCSFEYLIRRKQAWLVALEVGGGEVEEQALF